MLLKTRKTGIKLKSAIFSIRWYPSGTSCVNTSNRSARLQQMPPLMVRKAEWRR